MSGPLLVKADYSQIELRFLAVLSGSPELLAAYREGADIHSRTAMTRYALPIEKITKPMRNMAKRVNFGIPYGLTPEGQMGQIRQDLINDELPQEVRDELAEITLHDCEEFDKAFHKTYTRVREYMDEQIAFVHKHGCVYTHYGRRRTIPEINAADPGTIAYAERAAINMPIQGSAADLMKIAIPRVRTRLYKAFGRKVRLVLTIHDELICWVPNLNYVVPVAHILQEEMENADPTLPVPIVAEPEYGSSLGESKPDEKSGLTLAESVAIDLKGVT